jgi:hypothetical protein
MKLFALYRRSYGDFDVPFDVPVAVSASRETLKIECDWRNTTRTKEELDAEVGFYVSNKKEIKLL